jgi:hypothetical protein
MEPKIAFGPASGSNRLLAAGELGLGDGFGLIGAAHNRSPVATRRSIPRLLITPVMIGRFPPYWL